MPIELHWANNEQSILIEKFYDVWTWAEVGMTCHHEIVPLVMDSASPIVLIQDMIGSHWTPTTQLMRDVEQLMHKYPCPHQVRMLLVVSGEASVNTLVSSAYRRFGNPNQIYQASPTVNQALEVAHTFLGEQ